MTSSSAQPGNIQPGNIQPGNIQQWSRAAVFVSSTWLNLQEERKAVEAVLQRFRETKFAGMEYFGSRSETTEAASIHEVEQSQLYIGVIGARYGSGITETEYRTARARGLDCLIYFAANVREAAQADASLARFCGELRKAHTVTEFRNPDDLAARVAADLHNWVVNRWLTAGLLKTSIDGVSELPADYSNRIQNFLHEYLGAENRPVPFGGRAEEMSVLDEWLGSGLPYGVVAAPAGRGKSALVARWTRGLLARSDVHVVFFPVSIRFRTNLASVVFISLAARLARIFGEQLRASAEMTSEVCRGMVANYLRRGAPNGTRVVLVLDGLDEAADWEAGADLFPIDPPANIHVLVTARYRAGDVDGRAWLNDLGWHAGMARAIDLNPLTIDGLRDVLIRMGAPLDKLVTKVELVAELFRLSEGDPLLVRLYADDLWSRKEGANRLKPEDLIEINPGLEGYFERWWREQSALWKSEAPLRERSVQAVLNLLACSLGPLMRADLLRLAPAEAGLNTWTLDAALHPLERFVVGDGKTQGYILSHPRLANYFYDLLTTSERRLWESKFIEWGGETVESLRCGTMLPAQAPAYLVQYNGAHLERSKAGVESMLRLTEDGWRQAWLAHEGAYGGFLNDVERTWRVVESADRDALEKAKSAKPTLVAEAIKCALCMTSVRSLAANVRPEMLAALVRRGIWTAAQALAFIRQMPSEQQRFEGLRSIAGLLPPGLVDLAAAVPMPHLPAELAGILASCGRGARALEIARSLEWNNESLAAALQSIGPHLEGGNAESALLLSDGLPASLRTQTKLALAGSLGPERKHAVLAAELRTAIIEGYEEGIHAIAGEMGGEFVAGVAATANLPRDPTDQLLVRSALARYLTGAGQGKAVSAILAEVRSGHDSGRAHLILANVLPLCDPLDRPALVAKMISGRPSEALIARIRPFLQRDDVLRLLRSEDTEPRAFPLLGDLVPEDAWPELIEPLFGGTLDASALLQVCPVLPEGVFASVRERILSAEDEEFEFGVWAIAARLTASEIHDVIEKGLWLEQNVRLCESLAARLAELGDWRQALQLAERTKYVSHRNRVLIAGGKASAGNPEALHAFVAEAAKLPYAPETLSAIAGVLPVPQLREALAAAQRINDRTAQTELWQFLLLELVKSGRSAAAHTRVKARRELFPEEWLAKYASDLAWTERIEQALEVEGWVASPRSIRTAVLRNWPKTMQREGLEVATRVTDEEELAETIALLASRLQDAGEGLLERACSIQEPKQRARALAGLAVGGSSREASLSALTAMLREEEDFGPAGQALLELWTMLGDEQRSLVLRKLTLAGEETKANAIVQLQNEADRWQELKRISDTLAEPTAEVLAALLAEAPPEEMPGLSFAAQEKTRTLTPVGRYQSLIRLAPHMTEPMARKAWEEAWNLLVSQRFLWDAGWLFRSLPRDVMETAVHQLDIRRDREMMETLLLQLPADDISRAMLTIRLEGQLERIPKSERRRLSPSEIAAIEDSWDRAAQLTSAGWRDSEEWDLFQIARAIQKPGARAYAIGDFLLQARTSKVREAAEEEALKLAISGHLGRVQMVEALKRTRWQASSGWRIAALKLLESELATASSHDSSIDADLFSELGRGLAPIDSYRLWTTALRRISLGTRAELLGALKPMLSWWECGGDLLEGAAQAIEEVTVWWP